MSKLRYTLPGLSLLFVFTVLCSNCFALIKIRELEKEEAKEKFGITMHFRSNGDAGIKVWLEFKKEGRLENFSYAELIMKDSDGKIMIDAQLRPNPAWHDNPKDKSTVAFSAARNQLEKCCFQIICLEQDGAHHGYTLNVKDFLDPKNPITEK